MQFPGMEYTLYQNHHEQSRTEVSIVILQTPRISDLVLGQKNYEARKNPRAAMTAVTSEPSGVIAKSCCVRGISCALVGEPTDA